MQAQEPTPPASNEDFLSGLRTEAGALRERLSPDVPGAPADGARRLLSFAEKYAVAPALRDEALKLRLMSRFEAGAQSDDLVPRMIALLDAILAEHASGQGQAGLAERARAKARLREHYMRSAPEQATFFRCAGVVKRYGGFSLGTLDLDLRLGEITGVVGQNGHGKTTLLKIVSGQLSASEGTLGYPMLHQREPDIDWPVVKDHIAFVPQELPAWRGRLVDTLHFEAAIHGVKGEDNEREVGFMIERLDLGGHVDKHWDELSGGTKLRFALARALVWKPRLLVMDEPLANLDVLAKGRLLQDVRDLAQSYIHPMAVIMSSHDLYNLEAVCGQMVFLKNGQVDYVGDVRAIQRRYGDNEFEIGTATRANQVRDLLLGDLVTSVQQDGVHLRIRTVPTCQPMDLLRLLVEQGIAVSYFRDNSASIRRLFS
ncbi:ATP-binding cassette domain-containing protein [Roseateles sp. BYS78W]|uniref:ATP-binding cassette domain-containing protein n=1 Tax=Pelomonas candidula TaxID=3299025 RepID=A0ABW7HEU6_9BURK